MEIAKARTAGALKVAPDITPDNVEVANPDKFGPPSEMLCNKYAESETSVLTAI